MIRIASWNIQYGRGADGRVDIHRVGDSLLSQPVPDVLCLQEVSCSDPQIDGRGDDQAAILAARFPEHEVVFGCAIDRLRAIGEPRRRFGNLVLSRLPVVQVYLHSLPRPASPGTRHMPRQATEVVVMGSDGPLRVITTHLEYYAANQRLRQVERLRDLHEEVWHNNQVPYGRPEDGNGNGPLSGLPRPTRAVLCGDLNFLPEDPEYVLIQADYDAPVPAFRDAWMVVHDGESHAPTCGVHDRENWPDGPHCRDYMFVTGDLVDRVANFGVDVDTDASDHQPVWLQLAV